MDTPSLTTPQTTAPAPLSAAQMIQAQSAPVNTQASSPLSSTLGVLNGAANWVGNAGLSVLQVPESLGVHLGQAAALGTADIAEKTGLLGGKAEADKIRANFNKSPTTSILGGHDINNLKPGLAGAEQIAGDVAGTASLAYTPEKSGIMALGTLGAISSYSQSLAAGEAPDSPAAIGNAGMGMLFGGTLGLLGNTARAMSSSAKWATGVDAGMSTELSRIRPQTLAGYIETAQKSSQDYQAPTVSDVLNADIQKGADILDKKVLPVLGQAVGDARAAAANIPIMHVDGTGASVAGANVVDIIKDDINTRMQNMTGHQFSSYGSDASELPINNYPEGASTEGITPGPESPSVVPLPGRGIELEPAENKTLGWISTQLDKLKSNPTVQTASDILANINKKVDWERINKYGAKSSPVDAILQQTYGIINGVIRPAAPDLAAANDAYGPMAQVKSALVDGAGSDLQHLDLLARRTVYNGQSGEAQSVLQTLYNAVKPYLNPDEESYVTKAIVARWSRDTFGGLNSKSGLAQGLANPSDESSLAGSARMVLRTALKGIKGAMAPDPVQYAMSIARGEPYSFVPMMHHIDEFLNSDSSLPLVQSFKDGLKAIGVSSGAIGGAATQILKTLMMEQLTKPSAVPMSPQQMMQAQGFQAPATPSLSAPSSNPSPVSMTNAATAAIRSLSPSNTGQAMSHTLGVQQPSTLSMSGGLS